MNSTMAYDDKRSEFFFKVDSSLCTALATQEHNRAPEVRYHAMRQAVYNAACEVYATKTGVTTLGACQEKQTILDKRRGTRKLMYVQYSAKWGTVQTCSVRPQLPQPCDAHVFSRSTFA